MSDEREFIEFVTDANRTQISTSDDILRQLPYTLIKGVTATREGLVIEWGHPVVTFFNDARKDLGMSQWTVSWPDAAKRLRYRESEVSVMYDAMYNEIVLRESEWEFIAIPERLVLARLAAILCDDAEGFRVLHWCISNLGGENTDE